MNVVTDAATEAKAEVAQYPVEGTVFTKSTFDLAPLPDSDKDRQLTVIRLIEDGHVREYTGFGRYAYIEPDMKVRAVWQEGEVVKNGFVEKKRNIVAITPV